MTHKCPKCGVDVPDERRDVLGVDTCIKCTRQKKKPIGTWDYPENFHERSEGVGGLVVIDPDS